MQNSPCFIQPVRKLRVRKIPLRLFSFLTALPLAAILSAPVLPAQTVSIVQTNPDQSALLSAQPSTTFVQGTGAQLAINVDDTIRYQTLEGVGASFTDSSAWLVWNKLTPAQRTDLMRTLFSPSGIHLSWLRQPMGATDLALTNYTYDDLPAGDTDPGMTTSPSTTTRPTSSPPCRRRSPPTPASRFKPCPGRRPHG